MLHEVLEVLTPLLIDLLALLLSVAIGWLSLQAHRSLGVEVEARPREALHSAIMTGVRRSLADDLSRKQIIQKALHFTRSSVPDAVRALVKDEGILRALAEAKMRELGGAPGRASGALE